MVVVFLISAFVSMIQQKTYTSRREFMEQQKNGQRAGKQNQSVWERMKRRYYQAAVYFIKSAMIMAVAAMFMFSGKYIPVSYGAEGTQEQTIRKGFSGSSAVKENRISIAEVSRKKTAMLVNGRLFNESIKTIAAGKYRSTYQSDRLIDAIRLCTDRDGMTDKAVKELQEYGEPVYGWFEDGIIYIYTEADVVYLNEDCGGMFRYCETLGDFSGLSGFDASRMRDGNEMFIGCYGLITADSFRQWDTGSLEDMQAMFSDCRWLQDISGLSKWNVSHVISMGGLFAGACFRSLEGLSGWDTGRVENLSGIFSNCYMISDLSALSGWDVGNVTGMNYAFETCVSLMDVTGIAGWDTSRVESVSRMFMECEALTDASSLSGWDVGNLTDMTDAFSVTGITDASLYPSWYWEYKPSRENLQSDMSESDQGLSEAGYFIQGGPGEYPKATPSNAVQDYEVASPSNAKKEDVFLIMHDVSITYRGGQQMNYEKMTKYQLARLQKHSGWTYIHSIRVNRYAMKIGRCMGESPQALKELSMAARLHDLGKLAIPSDILDKPGNLSEEEYQMVKGHTIYGYLLLKSLGYPQAVCEAVRDHHERYDGKGYGGKKEIGVPAKIICAADSFDAMKFARPYKEQFTDEEIYQEMAVNRGKQFDPAVCDAVLRLLS